MSHTPIVNVYGLNKRFGTRHVVKDLSLQVNKGEIYGFLGPNGSGKTTSIRLMCGLLTPDSGTGTCLGFDVIQQSHLIRQHVGYMTQRFSLWEDLTIKENLDFVARMYNMPQRAKAVAQAIDELNLQERKDQLAGSLSGGWKQRLALAACLLHKPQLLLLDEPTAGVDPQARRDFWEHLHRLVDQGITTLVSTHYMDEAERCHRLAYISNGQLLFTGGVQELIQAQHLHTWQVSGGEHQELAALFQHLPGVSQVTSFGHQLHISGEDATLLAQSVQSVCQARGLHAHAAQPTLEDAFLHLTQKARP
jgi:ABC-2 type transport system ATP-binding protein